MPAERRPAASKMIVSDYAAVVTPFPTKNPRPGPDPGGGGAGGRAPSSSSSSSSCCATTSTAPTAPASGGGGAARAGRMVVMSSDSRCPGPATNSLAHVNLADRHQHHAQQQQQQQHHHQLHHQHDAYADAHDPYQISELLAKTIGDAHSRTCLFTGEQIADMLRKPQDDTKFHYYKNMGQEDFWLECAQRLTAVIQQIIEFAKMVPGFMKLSQDDQIVLLKTGSFELAVLRMSRYYDLSQNAVLFGDTILPVEAFLSPDLVESKLVTCVFDFAKSLAELKLTETELALYSAFILLSSDRLGLRGTPEIQRLSQAVLRALRFELSRTHRTPLKGDISVADSLVARLPALREISALHMEALARFKRANPHLEFPALHKELFSVDS